MSEERRTSWPRHIDQVLRSRHYTWIAEGLAGEPVESALVDIATDLMHICRREEIDWRDVQEQAQLQFDEEENELHAETGVLSPV